MKKGYLFALLLCLLAAVLHGPRYNVYFNDVPSPKDYKLALLKTGVLLILLLVPSLFLVRWYYQLKGRNPIKRFATQKFGKVDGQIVNLGEVFNFKWERAYLFSGFIDREFVSDALGFHYGDKIDKKSHYLLLFTFNHEVVKKYLYFEETILFTDFTTGVYKIDSRNASYRIEVLDENRLLLHRIL